MMKLILFSLFFKYVVSFTPNILLNGPIGEKMHSFSMPRSVAYNFMKMYEIEEIIKDSPGYICNELSCARERLRCPFRDDEHVSFFVLDDKEHLFTVLYRISKSFPIVYTVESIIRTPDKEFKSSDMNMILEQMCNDRKGFLQFQEIKRWSDGRYVKESYLEKQFK